MDPEKAVLSQGEVTLEAQETPWTGDHAIATSKIAADRRLGTPAEARGVDNRLTIPTGVEMTARARRTPAYIQTRIPS